MSPAVHSGRPAAEKDGETGGFADLHLHTRFSDGTFTPEELVDRAVGAGLSVIALTDHDTMEGCERAASASGRHGLGFIPGVELTAETGGAELHLLGYGPDPGDARLRRALAGFQVAREKRIREMVDRLNQLGVELRAETVLELANCRAPGRPHLGRALVEAGVCRSLDEAFERFLKKDRPAWVPKLRLGADEAIGLIHDAGGVAVLAHPGLNRGEDLFPALIEAGLDGIECFHSRHSPAQAAAYRDLAVRHGLLVTGGSDCHGLNKGRPLIGTVRVPSNRVEALRRAMQCRRRAVRVADSARRSRGKNEHGIP